MNDLKEILAAATPGPWLLSDQTVYTLRPTKWAGLDTFENAWQAQISQDGQHMTPLCEVMANASLIAMAPNLAAEVLRLRDALKRIATPEAFYVATSDINPEAYARMIYADYVLDGYALHAASDKAEYEVRQRYPLRGKPRAALKGTE